MLESHVLVTDIQCAVDLSQDGTEEMGTIGSSVEFSRDQLAEHLQCLQYRLQLCSLTLLPIGTTT